MKVVVIAEDKDTLVLHRLNHVEDLSKFAESGTKISFVSDPPSQDDIDILENQGFRIFSLSHLIRQTALTMPPEFSNIINRQESEVDQQKLAEFYNGSTVLVTGGEGFIGAELVSNLLSLPVKKVIAFGHGENQASFLIKKYEKEERFSFVLGDIRDEEKLRSTMNKVKPDMVFHAAAHKHVPILERYPEEAVKTNILGTKKTAMAAIDAGVKRFVLVSTDKAVNSTSALGASKRIAEKICLSLDSFTSNTRFTTVRFGNVFGSTGSVVPIFLEQIANGQPLTITDKNMLRYFMSIHEAVRLVLLAGTENIGNLFAFDMGVPLSIGELAERMLNYFGMEYNSSNIECIGNRGGEKFTEELIHSFEKVLESSHDKLIVLQDESTLWMEKELNRICAEFADAAGYGTREEILSLFRKYISPYIEKVC